MRIDPRVQIGHVVFQLVDLVVRHFSLGDLMSAASTIGRRKANSGGAGMGTPSAVSCSVSAIQKAISQLIRAEYPNKTWAFVACAFGLQERAAKHRLANTRAYTVEELQVLFRGDNGLAYLEAMMADSAPRWWKQLQKEITLCKARAQQERARQLLMSMEVDDLDVRSRRQVKRFSDADRRLNVSAARAETATGLLVADAGSTSHRTMAQAKGRR